jgi:hypothetical protein
MELEALDARRSELKSQLSSLTERRALLSAQMEEAQGPAQADLRARINALDQRTARIDDELNAIDDAVNAAIARGATRAPSGFDKLIQGAFTPTTPPRPSPFGRDFGRDFGGGMANVLFAQGIGFVLISLVLWRSLRRRGPASVARLAPDDANRLEQLQRSVDVMAVEIERISEGQRYVTKILNDQLPSIGAGAAEPLPTRGRDAERLNASRETDRS